MNKITIEYSDDILLYDEELEQDIDFFENNLKRDYDTLPKFNNNEKLEFVSSMSENGKQGVLGVLSKGIKKYIYKLSQNITNIIKQEYTVLKGLNSIREFCPHFCKGLGLFTTKVIDKYRKIDNPFFYNKGDGTVKTNVLLLERINGRKLYRYIKNEDTPPEILMSLIKQSLLAIIIAGERLKFTHNDLHSNNLLIKKCNPNSVFLYILDDNRKYLVPTFGYYPVIIDFGFSYNKYCEGKPIYNPLSHTDVGFITTCYDKHSDPKLFLTSVSAELNKYKKSDISTKFRNLIVKNYKNCNVDLSCGWDEKTKDSITGKLYRKFKHHFKRSKFFTEEGYHVTEILQNLVILPLKERTTKDNMEDLINYIITEFIKIENEVNSDFYNLYIFKIIVNSARNNKEKYSSEREKGTISFKNDILSEIDNIIEYYNVDINWEKLLCSLLCISKCIEDFLNYNMKNLLSEKQESYNKLKIRNNSEIYEMIDVNLPSHFEFDSNTSIYIWNCINKTGGKIEKLNKEFVNEINEVHPFNRGEILYNYILKNN